eukprot:UN00537
MNDKDQQDEDDYEEDQDEDGYDEDDYEEDDDDYDDEEDQEYETHGHAWDGLNESYTLQMQDCADFGAEDPFDYIDDDDFWADNDSWMFEADVIDIKAIVQPTFCCTQKNV